MAVLILVSFVLLPIQKSLANPVLSSNVTAGADQNEGRAKMREVHLSESASVYLFSEGSLHNISYVLEEHIDDIHLEYEKLFGRKLKLKTRIELLSPESFTRKTGAPSWTNAIFYKKKILIPISKNDKRSSGDVLRSLRHEYLHAVTHALSGGRCPGWLDEGIAQLLEGKENPALQPALRRWLVSNKAISFELLQYGFTKLPHEMVAPAYAQSLASSSLLVDSFGWRAVGKYLHALGRGIGSERAFEISFGLDEIAFRRMLEDYLTSWRKDRHVRVVPDSVFKRIEEDSHGASRAAFGN
jgi:hypothetical protein